MSDNITVKDSTGATVTLITKDTGSGVQLPGHHIADPTTPSQKMAVDSTGRAATTLADGSSVSLGAKADAAATTDTGTFTFIALFKRLLATYFAAGLKILSQQGAANIAVSQVATSTTAGTLAAARATRRSLTVKNLDAAITVFIGPGTVTAANGMPLKAGESITVTWVGLVQAIAASGTPSLAISDEFD